MSAVRIQVRKQVSSEVDFSAPPASPLSVRYIAYNKDDYTGFKSELEIDSHAYACIRLRLICTNKH